MSKIRNRANEYINAYMKIGKFSGSILIAKNGKILLSKGYGMANFELDVPNIPKTKFRLASITKPFTAMAIMQLQEKGLLSVDGRINKYLPDYPETGEDITIHHLLTHTSGIPDFTDFPEYATMMKFPCSIEKTIEKFKDKPLEFTPCEKFSYSNSGYILLSAIIEKLSKISYEEYIKREIFQPLNMENSGYDHHRTLLKNRASGYSLIGDKLINADYYDMSIPSGAGGLYSTVEDMFLWDQALYTEKLVKKTSLEKMFTPFKANYGYGWFINKKFNRKCISHGGGVNGFSTYIARYVDDRLVIVVLSNNDEAPTGDIADGLAAIVFGEKYEMPKERIAINVDPRIYNKYLGKYELQLGPIITISQEKGQLFSQLTGQRKVKIYPESETKYFFKDTEAQIIFIKDDRGEVAQLILHQRGMDIPGNKIKVEK